MPYPKSFLGDVCYDYMSGVWKLSMLWVALEDRVDTGFKNEEFKLFEFESS